MRFSDDENAGLLPSEADLFLYGEDVVRDV